jgi:hypothetical protein
MACSPDYTLKIYYQNPPEANNKVNFYALLAPKSMANRPPVTTSWNVTNKENFETLNNSYTPAMAFEQVAYTFVFPGVYEILYKMTCSSGSCQLKFKVEIKSNCTVCQVLDPASGQCEDIVLPPLPPKTIGPIGCSDVKCSPGQNKDCPIIYKDQKAPSITSQTNPCTGTQVYNFATGRCVDKKEYCCKYASTDGKTLVDGNGAANDPVCNDILKTVPRLKKTGLPTPCTGKAGENACCQPRNASARQCAAYYEKGYSWETPLSCTGIAAPFADYSGEPTYIKEQTKTFTDVNESFELMPTIDENRRY